MYCHNTDSKRTFLQTMCFKTFFDKSTNNNIIITQYFFKTKKRMKMLASIRIYSQALTINLTL
jgi:hypothetical protein